MSDITVNTQLTDEEKSSWDWDTSVAKVRGIWVGSYRKVSRELLEEMYQAKRQLSRRGRPHGNNKTWKAWVEQVLGEDRVRTADNWLRRYEIGDEEWLEEAREKRALKKLENAEVDIDSMYYKRHFKDDDGNTIVQLDFPEFKNIIYEVVIPA